MRRTARRDGNHGTVVTALRNHGVTVVDTAGLGNGFPDLVCGYRGLTVLMEIKLPQSDRVRGGAGGTKARHDDDYDPYFGFTEAERDFHARWLGQPIAIVHTEQEALTAMGLGR